MGPLIDVDGDGFEDIARGGYHPIDLGHWFGVVKARTSALWKQFMEQLSKLNIQLESIRSSLQYKQQKQ